MFAAMEAGGNLVGLALSANGWRMGRQIAGGSDKSMCTSLSAAQRFILDLIGNKKSFISEYKKHPIFENHTLKMP